MAISLQKLTTSSATKNVFISFIKPKNVYIYEHIPNKNPYEYNNFLSPPQYQISKNISYSVTEIPPPYCNICKKFMTTNECNNMIQPKNCPLN